MEESEALRYRGRLITDMSRDELLAALREMAAYDRASQAMHQEHTATVRTLMGLPVVECDDLPSCEGIVFGKPLI